MKKSNLLAMEDLCFSNHQGINVLEAPVLVKTDYTNNIIVLWKLDISYRLQAYQNGHTNRVAVTVHLNYQ